MQRYSNVMIMSVEKANPASSLPVVGRSMVGTWVYADWARHGVDQTAIVSVMQKQNECLAPRQKGHLS